MGYDMIYGVTGPITYKRRKRRGGTLRGTRYQRGKKGGFLPMLLGPMIGGMTKMFGGSRRPRRRKRGGGVGALGKILAPIAGEVAAPLLGGVMKKFVVPLF